ncbi:hypothetical protein H6F76_11110 [Leptolyngbya sp. FACHB-321]|uniref:hypothetical protein n=1 Tax=Leptolyngbya sp. FACHB-321 TaxID=2692807 RepID=UPI001689E602|nr:hypothetical protein [Leptolyngbya sp. FACHB-321]MBD2035567.1 hypothetical protein [Leptolyngbya sp. FACHB-321]
MSVNPGWFLLLVLAEDAQVAESIFEKAVQQSRIYEKAKEFLQNRALEPDLNPNDWSDLCLAYDLFYPDGFTKILNDIAADRSSIMPGDELEEATLALKITDRESATMILWVGLGYEQTSRLPGYFGNMFVPPKDVADVLQTVEQILGELNSAEFDKRAEAVYALGYYKNFPQTLLSLLLSSLRTALHEGNGLLALSYPHIGDLL